LSPRRRVRDVPSAHVPVATALGGARPYWPRSAGFSSMILSALSAEKL
jgi:hypothetical protein